MSKIEINNFKMHCDTLSATLRLSEEFSTYEIFVIKGLLSIRPTLNNTCFMLADVTCNRYIHIGTIHKVLRHF